jgi:hypothetical protein
MPAGVRHYYYHSDCPVSISNSKILYAVTGSLPLGHLFKHNPNYFQIAQPGKSSNTYTSVPMEAAVAMEAAHANGGGRTNGGGPYQLRRPIPMEAAVLIKAVHNNGGGCTNGGGHTNRSCPPAHTNGGDL